MMLHHNCGKTLITATILLPICWMAGLTVLAAAPRDAAVYDSYESLHARLSGLTTPYRHLIRIHSLGQTTGQRALWLAEISASSETSPEDRPALLVVGGLEGHDMIGTHIAVAWIESLLQQYSPDPNVSRLLRENTIYVIPRMNPDAAERYFADLRIESPLSDKPYDNDHDGWMDEDGPDDLNRDRQITWMRVEDPDGTFIMDPREKRLLLQADPFRGEVGQWRYLREGIDNDGDEQWNEDGPGGVNLNRNFPYHYRYFDEDAGIHQVSEKETRALADFVIQHPHIGLVLTFGSADNLLKTPESTDGAGSRQPMNAIDKEDIGYFQAMGQRYRQVLGLSKELEGKSLPGTFGDWMYFHRGRLSLAICPWSPSLAMELFEVGHPEDPNDPNDRNGPHRPPDPKSPKGKEQDKRNVAERSWLRWFDQYDPNAFMPWQSVDHPDFPGQRVDVGGYRPYALSHPPESLLEQVISRQCRFLTEAAGCLPHIGIRDARARHLGESIFEVDIEIANTGFLPTTLAHGVRTGEVFPTRLQFELLPEELLAGDRLTVLPPISGSGGVARVRCIVRCPGRTQLNFEVISMLAGRLKGSVELPKDNPQTTDPNHETY